MNETDSSVAGSPENLNLKQALRRASCRVNVERTSARSLPNVEPTHCGAWIGLGIRKVRVGFFGLAAQECGESEQDFGTRGRFDREGDTRELGGTLEAVGIEGSGR